MKDFFLLDSSLSKKAYPFLALGARVFIGFLMLTHGIPKIFSFNLLSATFPDPIGLGSIFRSFWPYLPRWDVRCC